MNAPRTPLINTRQGLALVGNDRELYLLFLRQFSQDDTLRSLAAALRAGDAPAAYLHAHSLKGLCASRGGGALCPAPERLRRNRGGHRPLRRPRFPLMRAQARICIFPRFVI